MDSETKEILIRDGLAVLLAVVLAIFVAVILNDPFW